MVTYYKFKVIIILIVVCYGCLFSAVGIGQGNDISVMMPIIEAKNIDRIVIDWFNYRMEINNLETIHTIESLLVQSEIEPTTSEAAFDIQLFEDEQLLRLIWVSQNGNWGTYKPMMTLGCSRNIGIFVNELRRGGVKGHSDERLTDTPVR